MLPELTIRFSVPYIKRLNMQLMETSTNIQTFWGDKITPIKELEVGIKKNKYRQISAWCKLTLQLKFRRRNYNFRLK